MKKLYDYVVVGFILLLLAACEKEGGTPTITGVEPATLTASKTEVPLEATTPKAVALQLMWNISELQSTETIALSQMKTTVQFSTNASFASVGRSVDVVSASLSYTHQQLNSMVLALGFVPLEQQPIYARVVCRLAPNVEPLYSNVLELAVTAFEPVEDGDYLFMANGDFSAFPWKLCARLEDGIYDGFVQVDQWYNFYLANEASADAQTIYGSYPVDGNQYVLYAGDDRWNCWTNNGGYLYLRADVNAMAWSETVVRSLSVTGDFNGWSPSANPMVYDQEQQVWTATITTTAPEQWGMKILINESWSWFFGGSETEGVCNLYTADADGFAYEEVGTYRLILDLRDPKAFRYSVEPL